MEKQFSDYQSQTSEQENKYDGDEEEHAETNEEKEVGCWADMCSSNWNRIEIRMKKGKLTEEQYGERLKASWELCASLSGFIAGFTYIVSNGVSEYNEEYNYIKGTHVERADLFIILVIIAFIFSLTSTLLGVLLIGVINQIGVENGYVFRRRHGTLSGLPEQALVLSILFMLISALVSIGGFVATSVWLSCLGLGVLFTIFILYTYYKTIGHHEVMAVMDDYDNEHKNDDKESKQKDDVQSALLLINEQMEQQNKILQQLMHQTENKS